MSKTVYLKLRQLTKTNKADVYLSDIADVYADKKILARIKSIKVACFYKVKKDRACINVMQVISCINQLDDTLEINNIGESDAVIEYKKKGPAGMDEYCYDGNCLYNNIYWERVCYYGIQQ